MKYVLLGSISPSWLGKQAERLTKSNEKLKQLGIKQESVLYTQGQYDFVETIEASGPSVVIFEGLLGTLILSILIIALYKQLMDR